MEYTKIFKPHDRLMKNWINISTLFLIYFIITISLVEAKTAAEWYNEGVDLGQLGKYEEAIKAYDEALKINPQLVEAWNNKGAALSDIGRNDDAIKAIDQALKINPQYAGAWYNKGGALYDLGRNQEAIKAYDQALKINPQYADAWINKGIALDELKRYEEAIKAFDEALKINPQNAIAWNNKGIILKNLGRNDEAKKAFDEAQKSGLGGLILTLIGIAIELGVIVVSIFLVFNYFQTKHSRSITHLRSSLMGKIILYWAAFTTIVVLAMLIHGVFNMPGGLIELGAILLTITGLVMIAQLLRRKG